MSLTQVFLPPPYPGMEFIPGISRAKVIEPYQVWEMGKVGKHKICLSEWHRSQPYPLSSDAQAISLKVSGKLPD